MKGPTSNTWPLNHPPSLPTEGNVKGEAEFRVAIEEWLKVTFQKKYLPPEVICLVPVPLLPDSARQDLPVPYLGRSDAASRKAIARFGMVTAVFQEQGASLFRRIHKYYDGSEPVAVLIRRTKDAGGICDESGFARLGELSIETASADKPHPGDELADRLEENAGLVHVPASRFSPHPEAIRRDNLKRKTPKDDEIGRIIEDHIEAHPFYVPTLAPILFHAQIVMVLARSIHSDRWERRRRFGAGGVTFLLAPGSQLTEDLVIRLCAVAQRVDGLLGSLHFATEDVARSETATAALGILKHSVVNNLRTIAALDSRVAPHLTILKRCLFGAIAYAKQEGSAISEETTPLPWKRLGFDDKSFDQTLKEVLWRSKPDLTFSIAEIEDLVPDSRLLVMIEELARNLSKGPTCAGSISIQCSSITGIGTIIVKGWATANDLDRIQKRLQILELSVVAVSLRGLRTIIELFRSLQGSDSLVEYALGEEAIERLSSDIEADFIHSDIPLRIWTQKHSSEDDVKLHPFVMIFKKIKLILP